MADITQTPANVVAGGNAVTKDGIAGETIVAGDVLYIDSSDSNSLKKAINATEAPAVAVGAALNGGADGQPIRYQKSGNLNPGGTVVVGEVYCVSPNAGKFAPDADVAIADFRTVLGLGTTSSNIKLQIQVSGVVVPA